MAAERVIMEPYATSSQHVLAELERIDLLIRLQVWRARQIHGEDEQFQGLYISEQEIDALLSEPVGLPRWAVEPGPLAQEDVRAALERLADEIARRKALSARQGSTPRLAHLAELFELSTLEIDALLICLAPEIDLRYQKLFAYLQDDVNEKRPSVDLVLNLLCPTLADKLAARSRFTGRAPLLRHRLVALFEDSSRPRASLLGKSLKVDPRIADYLFDGDHPDPRLESCGRLITPAADLDELVLDDDLKRRLSALSAAPGLADSGWVLYLQGPYGVGKRAAAEALCRSLGRRLLRIDLERLAGSDDDAFTTTLELAVREATLQGAALYWQGFDRLLAGDQAARRALLLRRLETRQVLAFLDGDTAWEPADALREVVFLRFEFPLPDHRLRRQLWSRALAGQAVAEALDLDALASRFRLSGGQIRDAVATARGLARRRDPRDAGLSAPDLYAACRLQSNQKLASLARKITPRYRWEDIVLPPDRLEQLREIRNSIKYRARVYDQWGFDRKLALGKGSNVLFAGPSGTGKTMAAEILAGELGLDLYKIDLSSVVSKFIGETEKNLAKIFTEAETSNAILFFDEADALFGKRSEVRNAHDRYANIEISYLLQRMEEYNGVVILATNLRKNMDDAFVR